MIVSIYSLFDTKAKAYAQPFFSLNDETAVRATAHLVNTKDHEISHYVEDYSIYKIGEFDDETGKIFTDAERLQFPQFEQILITA